MQASYMQIRGDSGVEIKKGLNRFSGLLLYTNREQSLVRMLYLHERKSQDSDPARKNPSRAVCALTITALASVVDIA